MYCYCNLLVVNTAYSFICTHILFPFTMYTVQLVLQFAAAASATVINYALPHVTATTNIARTHGFLKSCGTGAVF